MKNIFLFLLLATIVTIQGCKKDGDPETPPIVVFKTGAGYTSTDAIVGKNAALKMGIQVTKTEDNLKSFNVSVAYDGSSATVSKKTDEIPSTSTQYDADVSITTRNQAGTEKWIFTVTDIDGNIVQKTITLTVN
jgi:hypothetical protein